MSKVNPAAQIAHGLLQIRQGRQLHATGNRLIKDGELAIQQATKALRSAARRETATQMYPGVAETDDAGARHP